MNQSEHINEIAKALAAAQAEIKNPQKNKTAKAGSYSYKYADIADVLECVLPALSKNGIAVSQPTTLDGDVLVVETKLAHASGQWMTSIYPVCRVNGDHQKMGAALTYGRRYALTSMVGVAADDDADGHGAAEAAPPPAKRKSSAQRGRDGEWDRLEADLIDCKSARDVERLHESYKGKEYREWSEGWRWKAEERFAQRLAEFSSGDALKETLADIVASDAANSHSINSKSEYVQWSHEQIENAPTIAALHQWWQDEGPARTRFRLTGMEIDGLKSRCAARKRELESEAPLVRDKAGNALSVMDAG